MKTIPFLDRLGILPTKRAITNHRYSTDYDLAAALDLPRLQKDRLKVDYCRVSGHAQKPD